jgi:hypothetical protein
MIDPQKYELLIRELLLARLSPDCPNGTLQVHHNKKYKGKSGHMHQIDVVAELELAGTSLIIPVECKCYSHKVGIDEIMEFATRIEDIGAHKGIVVTTTGFQSGAVRFAKSKGIALVIAYDIKWEMILRRISEDFNDPVKRFERHKRFINRQIHRKRMVTNFLSTFTESSNVASLITSQISKILSIHSKYQDGDCFLHEFGSNKLRLFEKPECCFSVYVEEDKTIKLNISGLSLLLEAQLLVAVDKGDR